MAFSHENGLYGVVILDTSYVMATGGSIDLTHEPLLSSGLWGGGYADSATVVAYSANVVTLEGSVDYELTTNFWTALKGFGWANRADAAGTALQVLPNGSGGFVGTAWCTGVSFSASEGAIVTGSFNWGSDQTDSVTATGSTWAGRSVHVDSGNVGATVFPYWGTSVGGVADVIDWSANYTAALNFVTLCSGAATVPSKPNYILIGTMDADGSYTVFGLSSAFTYGSLQTVGTCVITMKCGATTKTVTFGNIIPNSASPSVVTGGDYTSVSISFTGIGDGVNAPMYMSA